MNDLFDLEQIRVFITRVCLTDDSVGRVDPRDQGGAVSHVIVAALEVGGQRSADRDSLNTRNYERRVASLFTGLRLPIRIK